MKDTLSVITNFGCDINCSYCIWKKHSLYKNNDKFDFNNFENIIKYGEYKKVTISGGGDPLHGYHNDFYEQLFEITDKYNINVELHSNFWKIHDWLIDNKNYSFILNKFSKIVIHISDKDGDEAGIILGIILSQKIISTLLLKNINQKFRLTFVINDINDFKFLSKFALDATEQIQISFRETVLSNKKDDEELVDEIKKLCEQNKNIMYIKQDDYATYLMPNNKLYEKYIF